MPQIEHWPLDRIKPYGRNPRRISDKAVAAVAESIARFGFNQPIVVDPQGVIIVGHTRLQAAKRLGLQTAPVIVADLDEAAARQYRLADNKTGEISEWDEELLSAELALLDTVLEMAAFGFSERELTRLTARAPGEGLTDPDECPEPPAEPITQPGDLWLLGPHRLICADCGDPEAMARLFAEPGPTSAQLIYTDPPYNVGVKPRLANPLQDAPPDPERSIKEATKRTAKGRAGGIQNDSLPPAEYQERLNRWIASLAARLDPGRAVYLWGGYATLEHYPPAMRAAGLHFAQTIIWTKGAPVLSRTDYMLDHEWLYYGWHPAQDFKPAAKKCAYGWRKGPPGTGRHVFYGPTNATDCWTAKKVPQGQMLHLTEKPTELAERALEYSTRPGETVLDGFAGSGSTLIAAERLARIARLAEIDPAYCDVIVTRWERFTGETAVRVAPGAAIPA